MTADTTRPRSLRFTRALGLVALCALAGCKSSGDKELKGSGVAKGKLPYLSPDIAAGGRPSPASDQFACGSVLWEALVGRKLFEGTTDYETYTRLRECMVQPLRPLRPDVPAPFVQIIQRALSAGI